MKARHAVGRKITRIVQQRRDDCSGGTAWLRDLTKDIVHYVDGAAGGIGFAVFLFDLGESGFTAYASNAVRDDVRLAVVEWLRKTENYDERMACKKK